MRKDLKLPLVGAPDMADPVERFDAEPGIFEQMDAAEGQVEIKARDAQGARMGLLQLRADTIDDELIDDLERWHKRQTRTALHLG